jgi:hypothetical protein
MSEQNYTPVYVAGNRTVHAGRKIGAYPSGEARYAKLCGSTSSTERHEPSPLPGAEVTCKRCLAKVAKREQVAAGIAELRSPEVRELIADGLAAEDAPATPEERAPQSGAPSVAELDSAARVDDVEHWRMTGAQYAELCNVAARAELSAARRRGLNLPREVYAEVLPEMCSAAAVAGLERAANVDATTGHELSAEERAQLRRTSAGPRWAACYTSHRAPAGSPVEWAQLSAGTRPAHARALGRMVAERGSPGAGRTRGAARGGVRRARAARTVR